MSKIEVNTVDAQCGSTITVGSSGKNVKIEGNDIRSNDYKASDGGNIINQSGTTITLGASGDTVSLASGASQSGFGRSGSVNWQTGSIKTSTFTAANGEGYFVDTSSGSVSSNLPAGSAGAIVAFADYTRTFNSNNFIIVPNGTEKIGGNTGSSTLSVNGQALTLVYVDATEGWINVQNAEDTEVGSPFISASGGTETTSGNCRIHTFTGPGTFTVNSIGTPSSNNKVGYLVVAGGAGGASGYGGGGGGAGGYREGRCGPVTPYTDSPLGTSGHTVSVQAYPITVGAGGAGGTNPATPILLSSSPGSISVFSSFTSAGGGGAGYTSCSSPGPQAGGSGGGSTASAPSPAGAGNTPPVSPPQGNNGGSVSSTGNHVGGGGGGAGAVGGTGTNTGPGKAGDGGAGVATEITGSSVTRGGGGGGARENASAPLAGAGGAGGGGAGGVGPSSGGAGTVNTGGGGGTSGGTSTPFGNGGAGGSGIVVIRYKIS